MLISEKTDLELETIYNRLQYRSTTHIVNHTGLSVQTIRKIKNTPYDDLHLLDSTWVSLERYLEDEGI